MAADRVSIVDRVFVALAGLHASTGCPVSKGDIHRMIGSDELTLERIDEGLRNLKKQGRATSTIDALFVPVSPLEHDRVMTATPIPGRHRVRLEASDGEMIVLSFGEFGQIRRLAAGYAPSPDVTPARVLQSTAAPASSPA